MTVAQIDRDFLDLSGFELALQAVANIAQLVQLDVMM